MFNVSMIGIVGSEMSDDADERGQIVKSSIYEIRHCEESATKQSRICKRIMSEKIPCVYILTNQRNGTIYVGVTSNLKKRIWEHKSNVVEGFTKKYNIHMLVYYEICPNLYQAIAREKQLKGGSRKKKIELIEKKNPQWKDLYDEIV